MAETISLNIDENRSNKRVSIVESNLEVAQQVLVEKPKDTLKSKVELESRKGGKILPLSVDRIPQNDLQKAVQKLSQKHEFEKLTDLRSSNVNEVAFISRLHNVKIEDMDRLLKPTDETADDT